MRCKNSVFAPGWWKKKTRPLTGEGIRFLPMLCRDTFFFVRFCHLSNRRSGKSSKSIGKINILKNFWSNTFFQCQKTHLSNPHSGKQCKNVSFLSSRINIFLVVLAVKRNTCHFYFLVGVGNFKIICVHRLIGLQT